MTEGYQEEREREIRNLAFQLHNAAGPKHVRGKYGDCQCLENARIEYEAKEKAVTCLSEYDLFEPRTE